MPVSTTLRDVAKHAGVSLSTASQALNNRGGVSDETRARILEAVSALNYQPQIRLSGPVSQNLSVVGMLTPDTFSGPRASNPFYYHVLAGIEAECRRQGLHLMYGTVEVDAHLHMLAIPSMVLNRKVDGILIAGAFLDESIADLIKHTGLPTVLIDSYAANHQFDSIVSDNFGGAYDAVNYLIQQGHTRVGLIGSSPESYPSFLQRRKGYLAALNDHQLSQTYLEETREGRENTYAATRRLLDRAPEVTAIFACNDLNAVIAMEAIHDLNLKIPDDISIVGFDDMDLASESKPPLTTVYVDKQLMGALGMRHLREQAENSDRVALTTTLNTPLVIRDSVRSPNG